MTPEQAAAYVHAQSVAALAEIEGMKAENAMQAHRRQQPIYGKSSFDAVITRYQLHHNAVCHIFGIGS